ncbi:MAG: HhH-GPD-type base excision DNA repair protein [Gaiellales bacterium]
MAAAVDRLPFTGDDEADRLLVDEPLALLVGFVLDQQVPLQKAFSGPLELKRRLGRLDAGEIAAMDPDRLDAVFREKPALHRFPGNMAKRTQELCQVVVEDYGGEAARVWTEAADGDDLERRLAALPGFGEMKVGSLAAILGKQLGVCPPGWERVATAHFCLGDVDSAEKLAEYQAAKRARKAAQRAARA